MISYSELQPGEKYRILDQPEIWTKRKEVDSRLRKELKVYRQPFPVQIDGVFLFKLEDCLDFFGYPFETWSENKSVTFDRTHYIYPDDLQVYLEKLYVDN